jgi:hypothetical protein
MKIVPTVHISTESFKSMSLANRGCRFPEETEESQESLFTYYTQKTCMFECTLTNIITNVVSMSLRSELTHYNKFVDDL